MKYKKKSRRGVFEETPVAERAYPKEPVIESWSEVPSPEIEVSKLAPNDVSW